VQSPRVQCDRQLYRPAMKAVLARQDSNPDLHPFSFATAALRTERLPYHFSYPTPATRDFRRENFREPALS